MIAVALGVVGLALLLGGALVWAVKKLVGKTEAAADSKVAAGAEAADGKLKDFEIAKWKREAEQADALADHLAEELRHALANPTTLPGPALAPGDVDNRVLRFYDAQVAARAGRGVPAGGTGALHPGDAPVAGGAPAAGGGGAPAADGAGEP